MRARSARRLAAAPAAQTAGDYPPGDIFKGFLAMTPQNFFLSQVDLDGALLKAIGLADSIQNVTELGSFATIEEALPSLRSAGISLMADGRGLQLLQSIQNNQGFNSSITSTTAPPYSAQDRCGDIALISGRREPTVGIRYMAVPPRIALERLVRSC